MDDPSTYAAPSRDECILAALAHAAVILPLWGAIGAVIIWATNREKSAYVGFQSLQAAVYQAALFLASLIAISCSFLASFASPVWLFAPSDPSSGEVSLPFLILAVGLPLAPLLFQLFAWLAMFLYGYVGAAKALQGRDFKYVIIGARLASYLATK